MKKLKLKALELGAREVLTREQLRSILGGAGSGSGSGTYEPRNMMCCKSDGCGPCSLFVGPPGPDSCSGGTWSMC